jgi:predicted DNA-binding protein YlxM (UPF0122 family)
MNNTELFAKLFPTPNSRKEIAEKLKLSRQAIYQWKRVPVDYVLILERLTGVPRQEIRPDIYPPE